MKNPDVREGTEFPATVVFVVLKGLKDCADAPKVPNALRALNEALRGVDPGAFVLSTLTGMIVVVPDTVSWSADDTFLALDQAKVNFALRVGVTHGTVEVVRDIDDEPNLIGSPINIAARLATSSNNPGVLIHESYTELVDGTLSATHWLHRSVRKAISIAGKPQDPVFACFQSPHSFDAKPLEREELYSSRPTVLVAYDLPKFSAGDRAQLRKRFTRLAHVFQKLRQSASMQTATALLSPGGDGGVLVLEGVNLPDATAIASRLQLLTEIESVDHGEAVAVEIRIGVHYGPVTHYVNARGIERPTGLAVFVADEIAGDEHARSRKGIILTYLLAESLAGGSSQRLAFEFERLPKLTGGPAGGVERFVKAGHMRAGEAQPIPAPPESPETRITHDDLLIALSRLLPSQFEEVLSRVRIPTAHLADASAPQAIRAMAAIRYLEQQNLLGQIKQTLDGYLVAHDKTTPIPDPLDESQTLEGGQASASKRPRFVDVVLRLKTHLLKLLWSRWLDSASEHYKTLVDKIALRDSFNKSSKHSTMALFVYLSLVVYGCIPIARMRDSDFLRADAAVRLPFADVSIPPNSYFAIFPLLLIFVWICYQFLLGRSLHLMRRLGWIASVSDANGFDPDLLSSSLETLFLYRMISGRIARVGHAFLVWWIPPISFALLWYRLLPLRSTTSGWAGGNGVPAAAAEGLLCAFITVVSIVWSTARAALDSRIRNKKRSHLHTLFLLGCAVLGVAPLWAQCICGYHGRHADLEKAVLSKSGASTGVIGAQLRGLDLRDVNLRGAYLESADLTGVDLSYADLTGANLKKASLSNAILNGALLTLADLEQASGSGTDFSFAHLEKTNLRSANFSNSIFRNTVVVYSDLTDASLVGLKAELATFMGSILDRANLWGSVLYLSKFSWDSMRGTNFGTPTMLRNFYLVTHAECVDFTKSDLRNARFESAHLAGSTFRSVRLRGSDFRGAIAGHVRHKPLPTLPEDIFAVARIDTESTEEQDLRERFARCFSREAQTTFEGIDADSMCTRMALTAVKTVQSDTDCQSLQHDVIAEIGEVRSLLTKLPTWISEADQDEYMRSYLREGIIWLQYQMMHDWGPYRLKGTKEMGKRMEAEFKASMELDTDIDAGAASYDSGRDARESRVWYESYGVPADGGVDVRGD